MRQIISLTGKNIEDMTEDDLKREIRVQRWFVRSFENIQRFLMYHSEQRLKNRKPKENIEEQYMLGMLDEVEYAKKKLLQSLNDGKAKYHERLWQDRVEYADMVAFAHKAYMQELTDRLDELEAMKTDGRKNRPKARKPPKTYGYDPTKKLTKRNYPRDDWGNTKENYEKHRKRKQGK